MRQKDNSLKVKRVYLAAWLAICLLPACTFLYLPPLLPSQPLESVLELTGSSGLRVRGNGLELALQLTRVPEEGWLAVQWYSPQNALLASDSQWLTPEQVGFSVVFGLPGDTPISSGDWRAVVSFQETFVRQFSLTVP